MSLSNCCVRCLMITSAHSVEVYTRHVCSPLGSRVASHAFLDLLQYFFPICSRQNILSLFLFAGPRHLLYSFQTASIYTQAPHLPTHCPEFQVPLPRPACTYPYHCSMRLHSTELSRLLYSSSSPLPTLVGCACRPSGCVLPPYLSPGMSFLLSNPYTPMAPSIRPPRVWLRPQCGTESDVWYDFGMRVYSSTFGRRCIRFLAQL